MKYKCPKCDNTTYEIGEMKATGGTLSKIFVTKHIKQTMRTFTFVILCILLFGAQTTFGQNKTDIIIGSQFIIKSNILNEERTCLISIPDSYNDSTEAAKKYPIIILLDGYTHFKTASGIVHFMSSNRNRNNLMPESIIIAIENVDRERDFTVTKIKTLN